MTMRAHHDMVDRAGSEPSSFPGPPSWGDAHHGILVGNPRLMKSREASQPHEDPPDPFLLRRDSPTMARSQDLRQNATETFPTESRELAVALAARGAFSGGADEGRSRRVDGFMKERGEAQAPQRKCKAYYHRLGSSCLEQTRATEAWSDAKATAAVSRARDEPNRDGSEIYHGTSNAGESERRNVQVGWSSKPNGKRAQASGRGWVGFAEDKTSGDKINAADGWGVKGSTSRERKRASVVAGGRVDLVELRRRAWRFQEEDEVRHQEESSGVDADNCFRDGFRKSRSHDYDTEMTVDMDVAQASIIASYDVQMGLGHRVGSEFHKHAEKDAQHARTHFSTVTSNKTVTIHAKNCVAEKRKQSPTTGVSQCESGGCEERSSGENIVVKGREGVQDGGYSKNDIDVSRGPTSESESSDFHKVDSCNGGREESASRKEPARKRRARSHSKDPIEGEGGDKRKRWHDIHKKTNGAETEGRSTGRVHEEGTGSAKEGGDPHGELIRRRWGCSDDGASGASVSSSFRERERTVRKRPMPKGSSTGGDKRQERTTACGDADEVAKPGRTFDVVGTPEQTWTQAFDTLIGELSAAGHGTLQRNLKKKTGDKSRYKYCEVLCKHSGQPRKKPPTPAQAVPRRSTSKKMGCPFKIALTWPLRESNPSISSSYCQHSHDPRGLAPSVAERTLPPSIVEERIHDVRRWTASDLSARAIIKLLETDHDGLPLCKAGKRKVYNVMRKVKEELHSILQDASDAGETMVSEPGTDYEHTRDAQERIVGVSSSTKEEQDNTARFGGGSLQRRVYASMMAKSQDLVEDVMRSLPPQEALAVQAKVGEYVQLLLKPSGGQAAPRYCHQVAPGGVDQSVVRRLSSLPDRWERRSQGFSR